MDGFEEYYGDEMPWAAVPFPAAQREALAERFGVKSLPTVVALSGADGSVITDKARELVSTKKTLKGIF